MDVRPRLSTTRLPSERLLEGAPWHDYSDFLDLHSWDVDWCFCMVAVLDVAWRRRGRCRLGGGWPECEPQRLICNVRLRCCVLSGISLPSLWTSARRSDRIPSSSNLGTGTRLATLARTNLRSSKSAYFARVVGRSSGNFFVVHVDIRLELGGTVPEGILDEAKRHSGMRSGMLAGVSDSRTSYEPCIGNWLGVFCKLRGARRLRVPKRRSPLRLLLGELVPWSVPGEFRVRRLCRHAVPRCPIFATPEQS
mmetsp:Transcript_39016/g.107451  ORF Transcript_39016/g.107451 Transcript_39016/m.107451 type:complete len:251 (-) Transcript_39016:143-895(-)